jgi:hypothetical protein
LKMRRNHKLNPIRKDKLGRNYVMVPFSSGALHFLLLSAWPEIVKNYLATYRT